MDEYSCILISEIVSLSFSIFSSTSWSLAIRLLVKVFKHKGNPRSAQLIEGLENVERVQRNLHPGLLSSAEPNVLRITVIYLVD